LDHDIQLISEEFSKDLLKRNNVEQSVLETICFENDLKYLFLDPGIKERKKLGILENSTSVNAIKIREVFWLQRLIPNLTDANLVMIGATHISTFKELLRMRKIKFHIIEAYWEKEYFINFS